MLCLPFRVSRPLPKSACTRHPPSVSTLAEIMEAVAKLPPAEESDLLLWLRDREEDTWDREIEEDAKSGRLQAFFARLEREDPGERVPLDEFLSRG